MELSISEKAIVVEQTSTGVPLKISLYGDWKAREIVMLQRELNRAYRRSKMRVRQENLKKEESDGRTG